MWRLAGRYGMSDVGLAKICKRLDIPVPGRGYWQKLKSGKKVSPEPLPPLAEGGKDHVILGRKPGTDDGEELGADEDKLPEKRIVVDATLTDPHPLVERPSTSPGSGG